MIFNSYTFALFFAIVLLLHYLPFPWTIKKFNLLIASYIFYAAWNPPFVLLLMIAAVIDFYFARAIHQSRDDRMRRLMLGISLTVNLGLLGFFKYANFLVDSFWQAAGWAGYHATPSHLDIVLPLGISFYTFETISYLVDVYRRKTEPWDSFLDYALFLTFFPHLVAGPIVRANDFLPQCRTPKQANATQFGWGMALMLIGLVEKVVLADGVLAPVVDKVYSATKDANFIDGWLGTLAFSGQIYFDFAGYSACGIGVALCLGFVLNDNFHCPYAAIGFSDFWQRWHISLSSWLRDYLYIPLGGNRKGSFRTYLNLMLTMLLGGLWHGASWRFVAWGGLHGTFLIGERLVTGALGPLSSKGFRGMALAGGIVTYLLVCVTWVFFRADSFSDAFGLLSTMVVPDFSATKLTTLNVASVCVVTAGMLMANWGLRNSSLEGLCASLAPSWRVAYLTMMLILLILAPGDNRAFIYFQF